MRVPICVVAAAVLFACATVTRDGFAIQEDRWVEDERIIRSMAGFALSCAPESLSLSVLGMHPWRTRVAGRVGVSGCGKKLVYARIGNEGWFADTDASPP